MPRYMFRITDGNQVLADQEGLEMAGDAAAREEAAKFARDLQERRTLQDRDWSGWFVSIIDENGHQLEAVPILEPDGN